LLILRVSEEDRHEVLRALQLIVEFVCLCRDVGEVRRAAERCRGFGESNERLLDAGTDSQGKLRKSSSASGASATP